jgi:hypothetical protein
MTNDSIAARQVALVPRPELNRAGKACVTFLALLGMGAVGGGIGILIKPDDRAMQWSVKMLAGSPFTDFLIPGLIPLGLFGVGSFVVAGLGLARRPIAPFLAFAIGCGQMTWITAELAILGHLSFLRPTMFAVGLIIAAMAVRWGWPTFARWRAAR